MIEGKLSRDLEFPRSTLVNNSTTKESFALIILNYIYRVLELKDVSKVKCLRAHVPSISAPDEEQNNPMALAMDRVVCLVSSSRPSRMALLLASLPISWYPLNHPNVKDVLS